jgi:predicted O-methyltransferase YrrM
MKMPEALKPFLRPLYVPLLSWYYDTFKAPRRYHYLYDAIRALRAKSILEVGVWNGKRGVTMIEEAQKWNSEISYYGFDLFEDLGETGYVAELSKRPPTESEVTALLQRTGANIRLFRGNTLETLPQAVPTLPKVDFVFIDGGHSVDTIANDWKYIQEVMHEHTIVIFDDYWRNRTDAGCKTIVDSIDQSQYTVEILPEIDRFNNPDFGPLEISFAKVCKK